MVKKMNDVEGKYFSPRKLVRRSFTEQGSRFIADLAPVSSVQEAKAFLEQVRAEFPDATHHTYACRIGFGSSLVEQASDDREPAGTAGAPVLQYLQGHQVSDAVLVATRYFGGTKLGIGGLTRAYRNCARVACEAAALDLKEPFIKYVLNFKYEEMGAVTRLADSYNGQIIEVVYDDSVTLILELPLRVSNSFQEHFKDVCRGSGKLALY